MKGMLFTVMLMTLTLAVHAQPEEDVTPPEDEPLPQDSLEVGEDDAFPADTDEFPQDDPVEPAPDPVDAGPDMTDPESVLVHFFEALSTGDSLTVSQLISQERLDKIDLMLRNLKDNLRRDRDGVMARLEGAGYTAAHYEVRQWSAMDYLKHTVALPVMRARYSMYEMAVRDFTASGDRIEVPLTFTMASGVEIEHRAELVRDRDGWKVSDFMGLSSFP